jgi:mRNA deadenylase 3'-5' endonuclease subunit Ccr4
MCYNVLADFYHSIRKIKKLCSEFAYRFPQIKKEIADADCDILLLQEVDHFESHYKPFLSRTGYAIRRVQKRSQRDSIVIGFKPKVFELIEESVIDFDDLALAGQSLHAKHNKALVLELRHLQSGNLLVCVSTQLYFHP